MFDFLNFFRKKVYEKPEIEDVYVSETVELFSNSVNQVLVENHSDLYGENFVIRVSPDIIHSIVKRVDGIYICRYHEKRTRPGMKNKGIMPIICHSAKKIDDESIYNFVNQLISNF